MSILTDDINIAMPVEDYAASTHIHILLFNSWQVRKIFSLPQYDTARYKRGEYHELANETLRRMAWGRVRKVVDELDMTNLNAPRLLADMQMMDIKVHGCTIEYNQQSTVRTIRFIFYRYNRSRYRQAFYIEFYYHHLCHDHIWDAVINMWKGLPKNAGHFKAPIGTPCYWVKPERKIENIQ